MNQFEKNKPEVKIELHVQHNPICVMHDLVPFDLMRVASKGPLVDPSVKLKQQHSVAALRTPIHLLGVPSNAGMILLDSRLAC